MKPAANTAAAVTSPPARAAAEGWPALFCHCDVCREARRLGGKDVSAEFPALGAASLFCVTENHTQSEIDRLVDAIAQVTR